MCFHNQYSYLENFRCSSRAILKFLTGHMWPADRTLPRPGNLRNFKTMIELIADIPRILNLPKCFFLHLQRLSSASIPFPHRKLIFLYFLKNGFINFFCFIVKKHIFSLLPMSQGSKELLYHKIHFLFIFYFYFICCILRLSCHEKTLLISINYFYSFLAVFLNNKF